MLEIKKENPMRNFLHRLKMLLGRDKRMSISFLRQLTAMDFGRWIFKINKGG